MPLFADNMVKHLLTSHDNLSLLKHKIHIVPVCISYERIFDAKMLSTDV